MDKKRKEKGNGHKKKYGPRYIKEKDMRKKCNVTKSLCRDERECSVNVSGSGHS